MLKRLIQLLPLSILLSALLNQANGVDVDVFLLGGQSNAGGVGVISDLPDSSVLYNTEIMLYHSASMNSGQPARQWTTLRPASNSAGNFGPEIGFGNRMAELYPGRQIAIIKHAVGGTDLGADWNPGTYSSDIDRFGPQFLTFVETVDSGIDSLIAQGYTPVIKGMLWQQGERDARNSSYGPAYGQNLSNFICRVRAQFKAPSMPFVYGQVLPVALSGYAYRDQVRQGQFRVDEDSGHVFATDGARLVMTDDLPMNSDNLHISATGQLELGIRFADAFTSTVTANAVDFNMDGKIDKADVLALIDHWHHDEPVYDIAPPPFGDGIVDVQDLIIVAEHLFDEVNDPTLLVHWALDEDSGSIAQDSADDKDAYVMGDPLWQPTGGIVDGALGLDGIDDCVTTDFVLNPAYGPFSAFAYVKGGAPGQVVISQTDGANWLLADPSEGNLMTELRSPGRGGGPLQSQTVITDGNWHHIGLVWDGSNRTLYVDDVAVAEDMQNGLEGSDGGLFLGCDKGMEPGIFWSGLIDDVRIYDRVMIP
jgi:hypothetical protein